MRSSEFGHHLYERLSVDRYGRWLEVFGEAGLRRICDRIGEEAEYYFEDDDDLVDRVAELEEEMEGLHKQLEEHNLYGLDLLRP